MSKPRRSASIDSALSPLTRRTFLRASASVAALAGTAGSLQAARYREISMKTSSKSGRRKKVALVITEVRKLLHGQHFLDRFLEGYGWEGRHHRPPFDVVSVYVDQFGNGDLAKDRSNRFGVPIYPTVEEALTRGGSKLDVDGVVIVAEHGTYPKNEKGQTRYPRYAFFKKAVSVFESSGRAVPVFNDKHLSTDWKECVEMVEDSRRLRFPFLAGSSLPVTWRIPSLELPRETPLSESLCACYGGVDSYDFHGLETAQCMSERRKGGERGVVAVQALKGTALWNLLRSREITRKLLESALSRSFTRRAPAGFTTVPPGIDWIQEVCPEAIGYFMEHTDGFKSSMILLSGLIEDFNYAGWNARTGTIESCQMYLPMPPRRTTLADFFNPLVHHIEETFSTGQTPFPIERTLLTSGMTLFGVDSLYRGQTRIQTPEMANVRYQAPAASAFWRT